jgi:carbon storage regulator CsrA
MLILNRHCGEDVVIVVPASTEATTVTVSLVRVGGNAAGLGVSAPAQVRVWRAEVMQREQEGKRHDEPTR